MGLYRLLAELQERVLEHLSSPRDLGRASCVCRAWRVGDSPVERVLRRRIKARGGAASYALPPVAAGPVLMLWLVQSVQGMSATATRVAVLNVHMEGNLGDEYETTPLLAKLSEWGAHVDLYLANWQPDNSLSPHAVRQTRFVDAIYEYPPQKGRLEGGDYDVLISAPGPSIFPNLDKLSNATGAAVVVAGVTHGSRRPLPKARLVVFREIRSLQLAQARTQVSSAQMLLSGDFSFSFQPDEALLGYWVRHYRKLLLRRFGNQEQWHVLFIRNAAHVQAGTNATHLKLRVLSSCAINQAGQRRTRTLFVEKARTILASSDLTPKGDGRLFSWLQQNLSLASDQIFPLEMVEQMLGLLGCCDPSEHKLGASRVMSVISDRYHPVMAAHRIGAAVHIIDTTADGPMLTPTKLSGACGMIARYNATATMHLNRVAWERMRQAIMRGNATGAAAVHHRPRRRRARAALDARVRLERVYGLRGQQRG